MRCVTRKISLKSNRTHDLGSIKGRGGPRLRFCVSEYITYVSNTSLPFFSSGRVFGFVFVLSTPRWDACLFGTAVRLRVRLLEVIMKYMRDDRTAILATMAAGCVHTCSAWGEAR